MVSVFSRCVTLSSGALIYAHRVHELLRLVQYSHLPESRGTSQPIKHAAVADMKTQRRASYVKAKKRAVGSNTKEAEVSNSLSSGIQHTNHRRSKEHFGHWSSNGGRH